MDTWTLQKGFPVVTVSRVGNNSAVFTQEYFLLNKDINNRSSEDKEVQVEMRESDPTQWWIPISFTTQENPDFKDTKVKFWLSGQGMTPVSFIGYPSPNHWAIFNVQQTGTCRCTTLLICKSDFVQR